MVVGAVDGISNGVGAVTSAGVLGAALGGAGDTAAALEESIDTNDAVAEFRAAKLLLANVAELLAIVSTSIFPVCLWYVDSHAFVLETPSVESMCIDIGLTITLEICVDLISLAVEQLSDHMLQVLQKLRRSRHVHIFFMWLVAVSLVTLTHELRIGDSSEDCPLLQLGASCDGYTVWYADAVEEDCTVCCTNAPDHYNGRSYRIWNGAGDVWMPDHNGCKLQGSFER
jgi:hypothetical protein